MPMITNKNMRLSYFLIIIVWIISSCGDASIAKYAPKNQDEKEIVSLLIQYQDAKNNFDIENLVSTLHDKGKFTFECGRMVSKATLEKVLPALWAEIRSGNSAVIPIVHECINGDYYKSGELNHPKIKINNDTAEATVKYTHGFCRVPLYFSMLRENDRWRITRTEWGHN